MSGLVSLVIASVSEAIQRSMQAAAGHGFPGHRGLISATHALLDGGAAPGAKCESVRIQPVARRVTSRAFSKP